MNFNEDKIPHNLEEAVVDLYNGLSQEDSDFIKNSDAIDVHHTLGRFLRNNWSLWEIDSPLVNWFKKNLKIAHADDISNIILTALWHKVKNTHFDLKKEAKEYQEYWKSCGIDSITLEKI